MPHENVRTVYNTVRIRFDLMLQVPQPHAPKFRIALDLRVADLLYTIPTCGVNGHAGNKLLRRSITKGRLSYFSVRFLLMTTVAFVGYAGATMFNSITSSPAEAVPGCEENICEKFPRKDGNYIIGLCLPYDPAVPPAPVGCKAKWVTQDGVRYLDCDNYDCDDGDGEEE